jgi:hypothetical protein
VQTTHPGSADYVALDGADNARGNGEPDILIHTSRHIVVGEYAVLPRAGGFASHVLETSSVVLLVRASSLAVRWARRGSVAADRELSQAYCCAIAAGPG